jgi:deazaflavin-dependent oxidoreductase (nitroreductase family)
MALPDPLFKVVNVLHRGLYDLSGGRLGGSIASMPVLKLTTTGRRSGEPRTVMLTAPIREDDEIVLVASKGGNDEHPAWYLNLVANPAVTIEMDDRTIEATARTATDEEKAELWPRITSSYKGYGGYQRRTDRDIPVVICTPVD